MQEKHSGHLATRVILTEMTTGQRRGVWQLMNKIVIGVNELLQLWMDPVAA